MRWQLLCKVRIDHHSLRNFGMKILLRKGVELKAKYRVGDKEVKYSLDRSPEGVVWTGKSA